ncbi:hypothetical protein [Mucilaginibacter psychrotolerans]|uniref:Uncharacterized protein n=1 Tax=Mucilaginibacter psychrotolerans TaxID=1524096 RepID=A0A4Y8S9N4_9SPHI|nr:hypothetical protein [Mucilaginibacter psychrotolerans]TFF35350.1 hypothetical protein E2R66_19020 [Mucilaginibacter psychrotolerans]
MIAPMVVWIIATGFILFAMGTELSSLNPIVAAQRKADSGIGGTDGMRVVLYVWKLKRILSQKAIQNFPANQSTAAIESG